MRPENAAWNDNRIQRCPHPTSLRKPRLCALGDDSRITSVYWMGATFLSERRRLCQQRETLTASGASARDGSKHHRVPASPRPHWLRSRLTARGDSFDLCARSASGTRFRKRRSYCGTVPRFRPASYLCSIRPERNTSPKILPERWRSVDLVLAGVMLRVNISLLATLLSAGESMFTGNAGEFCMRFERGSRKCRGNARFFLLTPFLSVWPVVENSCRMM